MDVVNYLVKTNISINGQVSEKSAFHVSIKLKARDRHTDVQCMYNPSVSPIPGFSVAIQYRINTQPRGDNPTSRGARVAP